MKQYKIELYQIKNKEGTKVTFIYTFLYNNTFEQVDIINSIGLWCKSQILHDSYLKTIGFVNKFPVILKISSSNYSACFKIKKVTSFKDKMLDILWHEYTMVCVETGQPVKGTSLDVIDNKLINYNEVKFIFDKMKRLDISVPMGGAIKK